MTLMNAYLLGALFTFSWVTFTCFLRYSRGYYGGKFKDILIDTSILSLFWGVAWVLFWPGVLLEIITGEQA